jgi:hypothetical protein
MEDVPKVTGFVPIYNASVDSLQLKCIVLKVVVGDESGV